MSAGSILVGRELPLADLRSVARGAASGTLRVAVIEGRSGIGKSALAATFTAELSSWRVARVRIDPEDSVRSFGAVRAAIQTLDPNIELKEPLTVSDAAVALFSALDQSESPVCLRIEDAQWLDSESEEVLFTVARQGYHTRLLLLVETQPRTMGLGSRLHRLASSLDGGALIQLDAFDYDAVQEFFLQRLGTALDDESVQTLLDVTGGKPVYLDSIARRVQAGGHASRSLDTLIDDFLTSRQGHDDVASQEVNEELAGSNPDARWALVLVALAGRLTPMELESAMEALECSPLSLAELRRQPLLNIDSSGSVRMRHGVLRQCLIEETTSGRLLRGHQVLSEVLTEGRALTHEYQVHKGQENSLLAEKLIRAAYGALEEHQVDQACRWALWAATLDRGHVVDAVLLYLRCGRLDRLIALQPFFRADMKSLPARAHRALTNLDKAAVLAEFDVVDPDELRSLADRELIAVAYAVFHVARIRSGYGEYGQPDQTISALRRELDERVQASKLSVSEDSLESAAMVTSLSTASHDLGIWQEFDGLSQHQIGQLCTRVDRYIQRLETEPGTQATRAFATSLLASTAFLYGDYSWARDVAASSRSFDELDWKSALHLRVNASRMDFYSGLWDEAHLGLQRALGQSWGDREDISSLLIRACSALVPFCRGELETAGQELQGVLAVTAGSTAYSAPLAMVGFVRAWGTFTNRGPARAIIESLGPMWESSLGGTFATVPTAVILCRALVDEGQQEKARQIIASLTDFEIDPNVLGYVVAHCKGIVAASEKRYEQAQGAFQRAGEILRGLEGRPLRIFEAVLAEDSARLAISQQTLPHPTEELDEAIALLRRVRCPAWKAALEQLRSQVTDEKSVSRPADDQIPEVLADLTSRERDVALRVAHGLSNREIASEDVVSVRTVEYHVSNILRKTQLGSLKELRQSIQREFSAR